MSDYDGLRGCRICGNDTLDELCLQCRQQKAIDEGLPPAPYPQTDDETIKPIWLTDPAGGGMMESPGMIVVQHRNIRVVAHITMPEKARFDPGELRVTQGALDELGADGVQRAFEQFIRCEWSDMPTDDKRSNDVMVKYGTGILYDFPTEDTMTVGYIGDNSTLILRSEY